MGALVEILFYAVVITLGIAAMVAFGSTLIAIGAIYGAGISIYNYALSLKNNFKFEEHSGVATGGEPAIKSYVYEKGFHDLVGVVKDNWNRNILFIGESRKKMTKSDEIIHQIIWGAAALATLVFGTLFFLIISFFHFIILGLLYLLLYLLFSIVLVVENIYLFIHQYFAACPYCHTKTTLPEYLCDKCNAIHTKLIPNKYGVFHHTCQCGNKLPSTFFLNRGRLQARCTHCHQFLLREHIESKRLFIPILGGPSVGKTTFMFSAIKNLIEHKAKDLGYTTEFIDKNTESKYDTVVQSLKNGYLPAKTVENIPKAFNLGLKKNDVLKWLLYVYDPAGEAYNTVNDVSSHNYNEYMSGMIFIIDPFSFDEVKSKYKTVLSQKNEIAASRLSVEDALTRTLLALEESYGLSKTGKIKKPFAIVLNKVDALTLDQPNNKEGEEDFVRNKLTEWGEASLLQQIETRFSHFRFFTCSALERATKENIKVSHGQDTLEPLLWIANTISKDDFHY